MKKLVLLAMLWTMHLGLHAQAPTKMSYQAVLRNPSGELVGNKQIRVKVSILEKSENGNVVFAELQQVATNANGLFSLIVGDGKAESGDIAKIDWSKGLYYIKTEIDPDGGTNFSLVNTSQLLSVPYALYATNATPGPKGDKGEVGLNGADGKDGLPGSKGDKGDIGNKGTDGKDGAQGPKGDNGLPGDKGADGKDGIQGLKGDKGDAGDKGADGKDGAQGLKGDNGLPGDKGADGKDGVQGPKGDNGLPGDKGADGKDGIQGPKGDNGLLGDKGADGKDGMQGPKGDNGLPGDKGADGKDGIQGTKGENGIPGDKGLDGKDGAQGPKGENGLPGDKGLDGKDGAQGSKGDKGDTGDKGVDGQTGAQGPIGDKGDAGDKGADGKDGAQGPIGDNGLPGDKGADGKDGMQGPKGENGLPGDKGADGKDGIQGPKGDNGLLGDKGADGKDGMQGPKGDNGLPGDKGLDGKDGAQGPKGENGLPGDKGIDGQTGAQGPKGENGLPGDKGLDGKDGVQGPKGDKGDTGDKGIDGQTGAQGPKGDKGDMGYNGADGQNGVQGTKGDKGGLGDKGADGKDGEQGLKGDKGDAGAGFQTGSIKNQLLYWNGTAWVILNPGSNGQRLTICDDELTWAVGGICPGKIEGLNCGTATNNGTLTAITPANGVSSVIAYTGGNGGTHSGQTITSTGVTGLTATLTAGSFAKGDSTLTYEISGTPSTSGTAIFEINIGGKTCTLTRTIEKPLTSEINFTSIGTPIGVFQENISDIDGNSYKTVKIGDQIWMGENLKVAKYNDGSLIENVTDATQWNKLVSGAWVYYNNDINNNAKYGKIYNAFVIHSSTLNNKNVCPIGWHVPSDVEWTTLTDYLGGAAIAGGKMKEIGTSSWSSPNTIASNISLFTGLPAGYRGEVGNFGSIGNIANWWSSTDASSNDAWTRYLNNTNNNSNAFRASTSKKIGKSIRCIKDAASQPQPIQGSIQGIDCGSATNNGTLTANTPANGVSSVIAYTSGNGGTHTGQTITSTGVTGLTATLAAGTFANGDSTLTYEISGTPSADGTASFEVNIGGKTCTLSRNVVIPTSGYGQNISDVEGNTYKTVYIGTQQWMGENLKVSKYNDGTDIPNVTDNTQWSQLTTGAWAYHNNDIANNTKNGKLYNWYAVSSTSNGNKNVCPTGWHVPTDTEWSILTAYLGGNTVAGGKLKEVGTTNWNSPNTGATNSTLFNGLPAGDRQNTSSFVNLKKLAAWWSSTVRGSSYSWSRYLDYRYNNIDSTYYFDKKSGLSVRCLKDAASQPQPIQGSIQGIDCGTATNNGTLTANTPATGVSSVIAYTGGNGGSHSGQTITSTGVTGLTATLAAGTFANGNGTLTFEISGTPSANGIASFELNIGGKTCTLSRNVILPVGTITTINCGSATNNGTLTANTPATGVSSIIAYTVGNGGTHQGQTITSTGVTGLTATLAAGTFAKGDSTVTYEISGTPSADGTASFAVNIGGKTCTLSRNVILPVGTITTIDCGSATNNGTLTANTPANGVSSVIAYTSGNGGTHTGQTITSTGVTGLTATLAAGTFANGDSTLTYEISGTPSADGTASFEVNIGGKTCTLSRNVVIPTSGYGQNISDVEGNTYKTVYIGTQQWMGENLKVSKYNDGTDIPNITDNTQWSQMTTGAWAYYNNDIANNTKNGKLYNWFAVSSTTNGNKNVCPTGWHVPSDAEWTVLSNYLGGNTVAGGKMKEVGTTNWNSPNTGATNSTLFNGLPAGNRQNTSSFVNLKILAAWWSSTVRSSSYSWSRYLDYRYSNIDSTYAYNKNSGLSIRCLKDAASQPQPIQGSIQTIDCGTATNNGTLTANTPSTGVSSVIAYTGGNGGSHSGQTITSTGVTGLTATLAAGTFANGNGTLTFEISGTPSANGIASFELNIGGKTCTLSRNVILPVGTITTINCGTATNNGTLTENTPANGVSSVIAYTGGNGGSHSGQTIASTGVTGLTATLAAGSFAKGDSSVTYEISGTPSASGTAIFAINIGSKTCELVLNVMKQPEYGQDITDVDGNTYKTVKIGNQTWMVENLRTTKYSNGDVIENANVENGVTWVNLKTGGWSYLQNNASNNIPMGKLYNWFTIGDTRNVCPTGWKAPSNEDVETLGASIGGMQGNAMKLKATGNDFWKGWGGPMMGGGSAPKNNGTNETGFAAFPSASRYGMSSSPSSSDNGNFYGLDTYFNIWTTSLALNSGVTDMSGNGLVWVQNIRFGTDDIIKYEDQKEAGHAIRCLKGETTPLPIQGAIQTIDCGTATNNGTLTANTPANGVSSVIAYTGGNGGTHSGQTITSTVVTGLTATLAAGTFANGDSTLTYEISGTPSTSGTAIFAINIGSKTCELVLNVMKQPEYEQDITDVDGNTYKTVKIGNQTWMVENLRTTKYSNGDVIENANVENGVTWVNLKTGGWSYLQNNASNNIPMGKLYNWFTIGDARNVCPTGWKAPSNEDVETLGASIGGMQGNAMKLKATGNDFWKGWGGPMMGGGSAPKNNGTNETGFAAFPSASRYGMSSEPSSSDNGNFYGLDTYFNIWTTSLALNSGVTDMSGNGLVWVQNIRFGTDDIIKYEDQKEAGHAIRCLKGETTPLPIQGAIQTIDCGTATNNGTLTANTPANGVSSVIAYTGGNGGTHTGQTITSTGVTGLTATLAAGSFTNGNGTLTYEISGTPNASGTASFEVNIGGKTCTLTRNVAIQTSGYGQNITDIDGNTYKTVFIGTQQWMGENLKVSKYNDGTDIPNITDNTQWSQLTSGAWVYYNNDIANNTKYGKLYNWYAVSPTNNGNKNVCPIGWHVPTDAEWTVLTDYLGGLSVAGGKMKEIGITNWKSPNTDATNISLFSGLPGGSRDTDGKYYDVGGNGYWWSSTEYYNYNAWYRYLSSSFGDVFSYNGIDKIDGLSIRCLKGDTITPPQPIQGAIQTIDCGTATNNGTLTENTPATGVSSVIAYTGGNGGSHSGQTITSTGVTGLTATLVAGTFSKGDSTVTYEISGTPSASGTASFEVNIGGKTCTLNRPVNKALPVESISALNCGSLSKTGNLFSGLSAESVSFAVGYSQGNNSAYPSASFNSTGVTGLTATLAAGYFWDGQGSPAQEFNYSTGQYVNKFNLPALNFEVSGTPSSVGTASFTIQIDGKTCSISMDVKQLATSGENITDLAGNSYKTVKIGDQQWMSENLKNNKVNGFNSFTGTSGEFTIPYLTSVSNASMVNGAYCLYHPDDYQNMRGLLYNSEVISMYQNAQICPSGWRIPTQVDYDLLVNYLGGEQVAAAKLKSSVYAITNWSGWPSITNTNGFNAVNAGYISVSNTAPNVGGNATDAYSGWWYSNSVGSNNAVQALVLENSSDKAYIYKSDVNSTSTDYNNLQSHIGGKSYMSIRCIKDVQYEGYESSKGLVYDLKCNDATKSGSLVVGQTANEVTLTLPYSNSTGQSYKDLTVYSTGVSGLMATIDSGIFNSGMPGSNDGNFTFKISGIPSKTGDAVFHIYIGGKTCDVKIPILN